MVEGVRRCLLVTLLFLAGCAGSPSALDAHSPQARHISGLWWLMFVLAVGVYLVVAGLVIFAVARRRRRASSARIGHHFIVYGGVVVPVVILSVLAVYTVRTTNALVAPPAAIQVDVVGEEWWWRVTYRAAGITTANEIHVPVGRLVDVTLTSDNV